MDLYGDNIGEVSLIDYMGDDKRAAQAARVSFLRDDNLLMDQELTARDKKLISFLIAEQHTSPFEHSTITFRIKVPLYIRAQVMRHRTFAYNEASRRYTSECIEFHIPKELREQADKNLQCSTEDIVDLNDKMVEAMRNQTDAAYRTYQMMLDCGVAREQARAILPQNMYTTFYMTGNLHNYIKFLKLRLHPHAQPEVQELAQGIKDILMDLFPCTMAAIEDKGIL